MAYELVTFGDIHNACVEISGIGDSSSASNRINRIINTVYAQDSMLHRWRWLERTGSTIVPALYDTGSVEVDDSSATVTLSSGTFTAAMAGRKILFQSTGDIYEIDSFSDATNVILTASYSGADISSESYSVFQDTYTVESDCEELIDVYHYKESERTRKPVDRRMFIDYKLLNKSKEGELDFWTHSDWTDGDTRTFQIWPPGTDDPYRLTYKYSQKVTSLSASTDEPLMPKTYRPSLLYGALELIYVQQGNLQRAAWARREHDETIRQMLDDSESSDRKLRMSMRWRRRRPRLSPANYDLGSAWEDDSWIHED